HRLQGHSGLPCTTHHTSACESPVSGTKTSKRRGGSVRLRERGRNHFATKRSVPLMRTAVPTRGAVQFPSRYSLTEPQTTTAVSDMSGAAASAAWTKAPNFPDLEAWVDEFGTQLDLTDPPVARYEREAKAVDPVFNSAVLDWTRGDVKYAEGE